MREQQRMAVWPYVEAGPSINDSQFRLMVFNQGIGPARIQDVTVTMRGAAMRHWDEVLRTVLDTVPGYQYSLLNRRVLPAQEHMVAFGFEDSRLAPRFTEAVFENDLSIALCYCSVYDECWRTHAVAPGSPTENQPVPSCTPDSARSFQQ
jgi:hypothetical protein